MFSVLGILFEQLYIVLSYNVILSHNVEALKIWFYIKDWLSNTVNL